MADAEPAVPARTGKLAARIRSGVIAAAVALLALSVGGWALWLLAGAVAALGLREWARLVQAEPTRELALGVVLAIALAFAAPALWGTDRATVALLLILSLLAMLLPRATGMAWGAAYLGTAAIALLYLRAQPHGLALALWALLIVWATDIGAFFSGRAIGGPRLAPSVSPNKTWAGLGGGMVAAGLVGLVMAAASGLAAPAWWLGAPLAIVAQGGDLFESALKRRAGVKDSGSLLPGHGGVLDRVDGVLPVVILVAALVANGNW